MNLGLETKDIIVFMIYFVIVSGYGYWIYKRKKHATSGSKDFFLAEGSLTWWAIGASLIASNISAEQFIGMSGSGFALGLGIATYEWMAAASLIIVAIFFLPIYLRNKIYTMPQFLERRYDSRVSTVMAVFWLFLYILVNLTSILYLGALSLEKMLDVPFMYCAAGLTVFAIFITLGGMRVIGYTDVIQVFFLVLGGLATTYLALDLVSQRIGTGAGMFEGLGLLREKAPEHFSMIFREGETMVHDGKGGKEDAYQQLPGLAVLIGAMWVINLNYWGCNQYIVQRALGADLNTARKGILFAAFLKLMMPIIVVLPGIACYVIFSQQADARIGQGLIEDNMVKPDNAYPILLNLLPAGLKGLAFAALTAAIVASLAGKANSIATIYSLDIHKKFFNKEADDKKIVWIGRVAVLVSFIIALLISPTFKNFGKGFQLIQEYTGFVSPGIFTIFVLGFFWKRANANGALAAAVTSLLLSTVLKFATPEIPFINRMGWVFLACVAIMMIFAFLDKKADSSKGLIVETEDFKPRGIFAIGTVIVAIILVVLYTVFW
jgi:solute:Na+ symporter, SSS family